MEDATARVLTYQPNPLQNGTQFIKNLITDLLVQNDAFAEPIFDTKTGALIVIEQSTRLGDISNSGTSLDAIVSSNLLENIFVVNTPLHDGATIIGKNKILASGCVLPLTNNKDINKKLGTRHRAGIGLSEISDAIVIIVSEETGVISLAINGRLTRNYDREKLRVVLLKIMEHREEKRVKSAGKKVKSWITGIINKK